jgi:hypothetical protein
VYRAARADSIRYLLEISAQAMAIANQALCQIEIR